MSGASAGKNHFFFFFNSASCANKWKQKTRARREKSWLAYTSHGSDLPHKTKSKTNILKKVYCSSLGSSSWGVPRTALSENAFYFTPLLVGWYFPKAQEIVVVVKVCSCKLICFPPPPHQHEATEKKAHDWWLFSRIFDHDGNWDNNGPNEAFSVSEK